MCRLLRLASVDVAEVPVTNTVDIVAAFNDHTGCLGSVYAGKRHDEMFFTYLRHPNEIVVSSSGV